MENRNTTTAVVTHLSVFSQYIIPFGNIIAPAIILGIKGKEDDFVAHHSKTVLNFQLSMFLYNLGILLISVPFVIYLVMSEFKLSMIGDDSYLREFIREGNLNSLVIFLFLLIGFFIISCLFQFILTIYGAIKAANNEYWNYPLTIKFLK